MFEKMKDMMARRRVVKEEKRLLKKLLKLHKYLAGENVKQRDLLEKQARIMEEYLKVLDERLSTWRK